MVARLPALLLSPFGAQAAPVAELRHPDGRPNVALEVDGEGHALWSINRDGRR